MPAFRRLSERRGLLPPEESLFEGVPEHMHYLLKGWAKAVLTSQISNDDTAALAAHLRVPIGPNSHPWQQMLSWAESDDDDFLELVDALLQACGGHPDASGHGYTNAIRLKGILQVAGSAWTVSEDGQMLERRVSDETKAAYTMATAPGDAVADELKTAWAAAFGHNPNPSDAWDHAITAVEDLLLPILIPNKAKGNLGGAAGELKSNPTKWTYGMEAHDGWTEAAVLEGMLRILWPNPDRHGGSATKRTPTQDEAEAVVHLAVTIVNLCRDKLRKK